MDSSTDSAGFLQKNLSQVKISPSQIGTTKKIEHPVSKERTSSDCFKLRKALLGSSPRLVIWKRSDVVGSRTVEPSDRVVGKSPTDVLLCPKEPASATPASHRICVHEPAKPSYSGLIRVLVAGILMAVLGCLTIAWPPYDILMNERLKMVRGLPAYEWWKNPPDEVLLRVYLFNITNSNQFLSGSDPKLILQEVGPYIFREKLRHTDVTFNENSTLTYTAHRSAIFLPEMNTLSLNATLVLPNLAVLGMSSYLWDANFITKFGFNMLLNRLDSQPIVEVKVNDYFWNLTDPLVKVAKTMAPHLVPDENMGILHQIYTDFVDEVTVFIGPGNGARFFTVDKFHGQPGLQHWENSTCDSVQGATEGVTYHQFITRKDKLRYLRKTICHVTPLHYIRDVKKLGMTAYRFELPNTTFTKPRDGTVDCYHSPGLPPLPSGVSDVSPCYYDFPIGASFPHFMYADKEVYSRIEGLQPDPDKHGSFVIVEPTTGVPIESRARSQSNLIVRPFTGFPRLKRFSNLIIPMFWAEYNQVGLPWYISYLMYFSVVILPSTQFYFSLFCIVTGVAITALTLNSVSKRRKLRQTPLYSYSSLDLLPSTPSTTSEY